MKSIFQTAIIALAILALGVLVASMDARFNAVEGPARSGFRADTLALPSELSFANKEAMRKWAQSSCCGMRSREFSYNGMNLAIFFRRHTSGPPSSEPIICMEQAGRWNGILLGTLIFSEMEATIEGDSLVLWVTDLTGTNYELMRIRLANLAVALEQWAVYNKKFS